MSKVNLVSILLINIKTKIILSNNYIRIYIYVINCEIQKNLLIGKMEEKVLYIEYKKEKVICTC